MKYFTMFLAMVMLLVTTNVLAQQQGQTNKIVVDKSLLTPEQIAQAEAQATLDRTKSTVEQAGEWVGLGKEIGSAVDGALSALTERTDQFAKTDVGKFTMFLVAYKVIGSDLIQAVVGIPLFFVVVLMFIWLTRRNCMQRRYLVKEATDKDGTVTKEWNETDPEPSTQWSHLLAFLICSIMCTLIIFV